MDLMNFEDPLIEGDSSTETSEYLSVERDNELRSTQFGGQPYDREEVSAALLTPPRAPAKPSRTFVQFSEDPQAVMDPTDRDPPTSYFTPLDCESRSLRSGHAGSL